MISIFRATPKDYKTIANIGKISVAEAHRESCTAADLNEFIETNYNFDAIKSELSDTNNIYHIITFNEKPAGFSKIILNAAHANINEKHVTKLDRIYLLKEYHDLKLGFELMKFNIEFSKQHHQSGMWLFTWTGNKRAINFYLKTGFTIIGNHDFKVTETHSNPNHHMLLSYLQH